ncbi:hypothetical protein BC827DRAFT_1250039, partial [Russula dissimulans]
IQASIEVGRSKYWRGLSSDEDFVEYTLESYLTAIHTDIVDVWNFPVKDGDQYLRSKEFKAELFHLVEDLNGISASSRMNFPYHNRQACFSRISYSTSLLCSATRTSAV